MLFPVIPRLSEVGFTVKTTEKASGLMGEDKGDYMLISCETCPGAGRSCTGCSLGSLMGQEVMEPQWDNEDFRVMDILVGSGLVGYADAAEAVLERANGLRLLAAG